MTREELAEQVEKTLWHLAREAYRKGQGYRPSDAPTMDHLVEDAGVAIGYAILAHES